MFLLYCISISSICVFAIIYAVVDVITVRCKTFICFVGLANIYQDISSNGVYKVWVFGVWSFIIFCRDFGVSCRFIKSLTTFLDCCSSAWLWKIYDNLFKEKAFSSHRNTKNKWLVVFDNILCYIEMKYAC